MTSTMGRSAGSAGRVAFLTMFLPLLSTLAVAQDTTARLRPGAKAPAYPERAQSSMIVGDVIFRAEISEKGSVDSVQVLKVPARGLGFEESVEKAVKDWKFEPARKDGTAVASNYVGKVGFTLRPDDEKALRAIVEQVVNAWNRGDAKAIASVFDDNGRVHWSQDVSVEPEDLSAVLSAARQEGAQLSAGVEWIQFFPDADLARVTPSFSLTSQDGSYSEAGMLTVVLIKEDGQWAALAGDVLRRESGEGVEPPKKVKDTQPGYPAEARKNGLQGTVVLEGTIDREGRVTGIAVLRSIPGLDEAAIAAVEKWQYEPARQAGQPVPAVTTITVPFFLE